MKTTVECIIAPHPPPDGREWDNCCARCGSSVERVECDYCGGEGVDGHDCGEDCCPCADPEENVACQICDGEGAWWTCLSSPEWCERNPLDSRVKVERGAIEWYVVEEPAPAPERAP